VKSILFVALGGAIGSVLRYLVSQLMRPEHSLAFPVHTFTANILGCFVIGIVFSLMVTSPQEQMLRLFVMTGILGGFTTFSSFGLESVYLFQNGASGKAVIYILLSNVLGIGAVWLGHFFYKIIA